MIHCIGAQGPSNLVKTKNMSSLWRHQGKPPLKSNYFVFN